MPQPAERRSPITAETAPPRESPNPAPTGPGGAPARRAKGALFRALMDAGADAEVAYTADEQIGSMISESVAMHTQPILLEIRQLAAVVQILSADVQALKTDVQALKNDVQVLKNDVQVLKTDVQALKNGEAEQDRKLDVLIAQMRILLGGLGLLVTVLIAVFGFLFAT